MLILIQGLRSLLVEQGLEFFSIKLYISQYDCSHMTETTNARAMCVRERGRRKIKEVNSLRNSVGINLSSN